MAEFGDKIQNKEKYKGDKAMEGKTLHQRAVSYHSQGDLEHAEANYRQAISVGYTHHATFSNLGVICKNSGRLEEAKSLFKKAISIHPKYSIAFLNLGSVYQDLGNLEQALASTLKS